MGVLVWLGWPLVAVLFLALALYILYWLERLLRLVWVARGIEQRLYSLLTLHLVEPLVNAPLIAIILVRTWGWRYPEYPLTYALVLTAPTLILLLPVFALIYPAFHPRGVIWALIWRGGVRVLSVFVTFFLAGSRHSPWDVVVFLFGYVFLAQSVYWISTMIDDG